MIRKIVILGLLAAFVAVATEAMSQNPASAPVRQRFGCAEDQSAGDEPNADKGIRDDAGAGKSFTPATPLLEKAIDSPPAGQKSDVGGQKSEVGSKSTLPNKSESGVKGKDFPSAKDAPASKTFPTSSSASILSSAGKRELVIERCLVTIKDDNKVPASEPGMLMKVPVKEGQSVEKDDLVAEIDTRSTEARRRIAQAEHEAAVAQASNDAEVDVANKAIEVSKADLDMTIEIRRRSPAAVPDAEYRKVLFTYEKSQAQLKQATNEKEIARLTANAKQAQFDAASIEIDLRQARAPFNGMVVEVMKKEGDWVTVGEPIMHIVGLDKVRVKGFVPVSGEYGASHDEVIGKPVTITVEGAGGKKHAVKGVIGFASPVIEGVGTSRQFRIWAEVDNERTIEPVTKQESWKIQPGSVAQMTIDLTPPKPALPAIPSKSDATKGFKGKVDAFKPVTGETDKAGEKKTTKRER